MRGEQEEHGLPVRLLQRLEEGVLRGLVHLLSLVQDHGAPPALVGLFRKAVDEVADLLDGQDRLVRAHLDVVRVRAGEHARAGAAGQAGLLPLARAVQRHGKRHGERLFAAAGVAMDQKGMDNRA